MNGESLFLNFGPVQEFLSEARRTRDLWAGSYLLSFLAGSAFCQAEKAGGKVILPYLSGNELYEAIRNHKEPNLYGKRVGSIPVMSEIYVPPEGKKSDEIADQACDKWIKAWKSIASTVWDYLKEKAGIDTDPNMFIRNRQIEDLWTCTWVQGQPEFMKRRKTLRSFKRRAEPGEKCTCCGTRQALSGEGEKRSDVRNFWAEIAAKYPRDLMQDGRERLCAVCTIKRFYPYVAKTAVGWETPKTFPSTVTMASLPWRRKVLERGVKDSELRQAAHDHIESLKKANAVTVGALRDFESLKELANQWPDGERQVAIELIEYDGDWFYPETINLEAKESNLDDNLRKNLIHSLEKLRNAAQTTTSIYYALLVMDGDRMGKLLSEHASQKEEISKVLGEFSQRVVEIVESSEVCGRVIYSGGDDVLAILPWDTALLTAEKLRQEYRDIFKRRLPELFQDDSGPTISAGLVYAHMRAPLKMVVKTAHRLLEEQAKDKAGRNAIAIAVWRRPGIVMEFARHWQPPSIVEDLEKLRADVLERNYSSSFLYRLQNLSEITKTLSDADEQALLVAEYMKSREREVTREEAEERVQLIQRLCRSDTDRVEPVLFGNFLATQEG